jgi:uroporphyrinogen-III decarboxylase
MNTRDLWLNIMNYGVFDRMPVLHWASWPETRARWEHEGMPAGIDERAYFSADPHLYFVNINLGLYPAFDEKTFEETSEYRIFRDAEGVIQKEQKGHSSIPHYIDYTLKTPSDWEIYKKRLQPDSGRIPADLNEQIRKAQASGQPVTIGTGSLMGWIRNWMGVENMCFLMYDHPSVYADMVNTIADLTCWGIGQIMSRMQTIPDMAFGWEDICGKSGPLVSPSLFKEYVATGYTKIRQKLDSYGIHLLGIDCDGDISQLAGHWFDAGVNVFFPIEIGSWNADPMNYRKQYGRDFRIIGGFNKLELEKGPAAIDAEIDRRQSLMRDGGFILMPDHTITPGTSLQDYKYYLGRVRSLRF